MPSDLQSKLLLHLKNVASDAAAVAEAAEQREVDLKTQSNDAELHIKALQTLAMFQCVSD